MVLSKIEMLVLREVPLSARREAKEGGPAVGS